MGVIDLESLVPSGPPFGGFNTVQGEVAGLSANTAYHVVLSATDAFIDHNNTFQVHTLQCDGGTRGAAKMTVWRDHVAGESITLHDETGQDGHNYLQMSLNAEGEGVRRLQAGDADQDLDFDQHDIVRVLIAGKYLTELPATWGEGDWDAAPGGHPGAPPPGDGRCDQWDIVAALASGKYLTGPYGALLPLGTVDDAFTSILYDPDTGELVLDVPTSVRFTSINIDSVSGIFRGRAPQNLDGGFDFHSDSKIFKAVFGADSFGSLSFGEMAQPGLDETFLLTDLSFMGTLRGGGRECEVDLVHGPIAVAPAPAAIPEPSSLALLAFAMVSLFLNIGVPRA